MVGLGRRGPRTLHRRTAAGNLRRLGARLVSCALLLALLVVSPTAGQELRARVLPSEGLDAESAALLLSQDDGGDLPLRATMFVAAGEPEHTDPEQREGELIVLLEMNRADLGLDSAAQEAAAEADRKEDAERSASTVRLDVFVYLLDADLGVVDAHMRVVQIEGATFARSATGAGAGPSAERLRYLTRVPVAARAAEARVLVRARQTRRAALRRVSIGKPRAWPILAIVRGQPQPVILDGTFAPAVVDWARSPVLVLGADDANGLGELAAASGARVPDPDAVAAVEVGTDPSATDPSRSPLFAAVRPDERASGFTVDVWSGADRVLSEEVLRSEFGEWSGGEIEPGEDWDLIPLAPALGDLAPGRYRLTIRPLSVAGRDAPDAAVEAADRGPLFQEVLVRSSFAGTASPFTSEGRRLAIPARELASGTRAALRVLVDGDVPSAVRRLTDIERRAIEGSGERLDAARAVQVRTLERLARTSEQLLPAIDLFFHAYQERRAASDFLLTTHARDVLLALVDAYLEFEDSDPAEAAAFLTAFAKARSPGPSDATVPMLEWAIDLDDNAVEAIWLRAAVAEAVGDRADAARWWRAASERSDDREVQLHLGVNLLRSEGRRARREGRDVLQRLVVEADWVGDGARAELARDALQRGDRAAARSWSEDAREDADPSLLIMRSYLAFVEGEEHPAMSYGDAGHRGQGAVPARRRVATAWQRRDVVWSAPEEAVAALRAQLVEDGS